MEKRSPKSHMVKTSISKSSVPRSPMPKSPLPKSPMPKSPELYEKYKSRCAYSLISFFHFRHGHSKKLISDNDRRSLNRHSLGRRDIKDRLDLHSDQWIDESETVDVKTAIVDSGYARVKIIKGEEVSTEQQIAKKIMNAKVENVQSDSEILEGLSRNHRRATKTSRRLRRLPVYGCYDVSTVEHRNPSDQNLAESDRFSKLLEFAVSADQVHSKNERNCNCKSDGRTHDQPNEINLQVNMNEATEAFINQKLIDGKHLIGDGANHQSKHFLDALEILNSNKNLFIKLLQDPNSLLVKHIEDLRNSQEKQQQNKSLSTAKLSELQTRNTRECSLMEDTGDCQPLEKIVFFRPSPEGLQNCADRISHDSPQVHYSLKNIQQSVKPAFFSFEQMKRKLMNAIGVSRKEQRLMLTNGLLHHKPNCDLEGFEQCGKRTGVSNIKRNSSDKASSGCGGITKSSIDAKRKGQMDKVDEFDPVVRVEAALASESGLENSHLSTVMHLKRNKHNVNIEPSVHIPELRSGTANFLTKQRTKTGEGISSVPEYDLLPIVSSRRTREPAGFVPSQMRFCPYSNNQLVSENNWRNLKEKKNSCSSPVRKKIEASPWTINRNQMQMHEARTNISNNLFPDVREHKNITSPDNDSSQIETNYIEISEETSPSEVPTKPDSLHHDGVNQTAETVDSCKESECLDPSRLNSSSSMENQTSISSIDDDPSSPVNSQRFGVFDMIKENAEQPSPVSVLDQFFTEVVTGTSNTKYEPALPSVPLLQIGSEEGCLATDQSPLDLNINSSTSTVDEYGSMYKSISTVLQACRFSWDELARKCHLSNQLLDQSLFNDIDVWPNQSCGDDHRLLFDYVNEVLVDAYQCYLRCFPWLSFIKPRCLQAPNMTRNIVDEVMKYVDWSPLLELSSQTIEQLIEKDLTKSGTWMNIQIDAEDAVNEMVDSILEELIIDIA